MTVAHNEGENLILYRTTSRCRRWSGIESFCRVVKESVLKPGFPYRRTGVCVSERFFMGEKTIRRVTFAPNKEWTSKNL